jgi:hypothetical protein
MSAAMDADADVDDSAEQIRGARDAAAAEAAKPLLPAPRPRPRAAALAARAPLCATTRAASAS